ncbi:aspartate--ammonia ligase [Aureivirga sp. CE67]|uniref:aspartate--ammonia ligase n=1 Tax=Aureivirga sp. CE67 TaxID=1788983 RepID=UPI0018CB5995|nr:aspartate--ammonia ligase [Aureivirga sp. CE67]
MKSEILKTEEALVFVKQTFETKLKKQLSLTRVSAPIAVMKGTGINDDLNGYERTVDFPIKSLDDRKAVIVNSLAKWKRLRLKELEVEKKQGIITDMRAIRPDEDYSKIHSIYVDQWDWEKRICESKRKLSYLKEEVEKIYQALRETEQKIHTEYEDITPILPQKITFIQSEELLQMYPTLGPKERENKITEKFGAVFLMGIGHELSHGEKHDGRAPDYDDWSTKTEDGFFGLNGDILVWHPELQSSFELSSMGIRVDKKALEYQLDKTENSYRKELFFHKILLEDKLPQSIGGGIGQSRLCMFLLRKKHIGEVQVGIWSESVKNEVKNYGIQLL